MNQDSIAVSQWWNRQITMECEVLEALIEIKAEKAKNTMRLMSVSDILRVGM